MPEDRWTEPGRHVTDDGRIVTEWPPVGRFAGLWARVEVVFPEPDERREVGTLIALWRDENATLIEYEDDEGKWHNVEPDWTQPAGWLEAPRG